MSDPVRISDMIGLRKEAPQSEAVWPLNLVLVVLGGAILGVAFTFLDMADTRLLYNPWTYAIATPIALMGISALLSTIVSQVVEKSMQLAFMLSVLIHLILMVCATHVVIFSRMWPDMLDSLEQQRQQLQRERLHAKQYLRVASTQQVGGRPDYLKPVATQHQPTEVEPASNPMLALARADRANLPSPSPQIELSHTPSLLQREQSATSLPQPSDSAASLSRSSVTIPSAKSSRPELDYPPMEIQEPTPLTPARAEIVRQENNPQVPPVAGAPSLPDRPAAAPSAAIARVQPNFSPAAEMADQLPATLERWALSDLQTTTPPSATEIDAPDFAQQSNAAASPGEGALLTPAAVVTNDRRSASTNAAASSAALPPAAPVELSAPRTALADLSPRRPLPATQPTPSASSDFRIDLPRSTAGGSPGAAAPSSMPVRGIENLGAAIPTPQANPRIDSVVALERRTPSLSAAGQLPMAGVPAARTWDGTPGLAGGVAGQSPSQLARNAADGRGVIADVAGMSGADRNLERSALGRAGQPSPTAVPGVEPLLSQSSQSIDFSGENPAPLSASGAGLARATPSSIPLEASVLGPSLATPPPGDSQWAQSRATVTRATRAPAAAEASPASDSMPSAALPRGNHLAEAMPSANRIEVPSAAISLDPAASSGDRIAATLETDLARRNDLSERGASAALPPANLLNVEALQGTGGIAEIAGLTGGLLGRRDAEAEQWSPPQLEAQRFARQDVGGLLAAGQQVAVPKPAFQQRIDRLKDRQSQLDSILQPQTELAIERGLEFLAKHQRPDGSWRLQDFDTPVLMRSDTAATGLALLAFQGAGYTHNQFKYAATVEKALHFLVQHQAPSGDLYIPQDPASDQNAWLYSHAIASLALCEAVGMTQDDRLRPAAQKAIDFMVASQDPRRGGWRYRPGVGADTSVTGWFAMAFKSGQLAGLNVPPTTLQALEKFLLASQSPDGESHLFRYNPYAADTPQQRHGLRPTSVMTSVGLLMRLYFGWQRDRPEMRAGADYLLEHLPEHGSPDLSRRDTYYWYYATQVMFHMRGQYWQRWHDQLYPLLINTQVADGEHTGSWEPDYPTPDLWARYGGRLYVTALNLLSLEVSYRHLPLYEATGN